MVVLLSVFVFGGLAVTVAFAIAYVGGTLIQVGSEMFDTVCTLLCSFYSKWPDNACQNAQKIKLTTLYKENKDNL